MVDVVSQQDPLRATVVGIRDALALSYVGLRVLGGLCVDVGRATGLAEEITLRYHGRLVGALLIARHSRAVRFAERERRLLSLLAELAAATVQAMLTARELAASRERIVAARETERLQLRRDLHDGLSPALHGLSMELRAVRRLADPDHRDERLTVVERDLAACDAELRAVVEQLRPPNLDGGLVRAVTLLAERVDDGAMAIDIVAPHELASIAPAIEVAAYRIVGEALTNAVRHSAATRCEVRIAVEGALVLEVTDDGVGLGSAGPETQGTGFGLTCMQDRAAEVGGKLIVRRAGDRGTVVRATLPLGGV